MHKSRIGSRAGGPRNPSRGRAPRSARGRQPRPPMGIRNPRRGFPSRSQKRASSLWPSGLTPQKYGLLAADGGKKSATREKWVKSVDACSSSWSEKARGKNCGGRQQTPGWFLFRMKNPRLLIFGWTLFMDNFPSHPDNFNRGRKEGGGERIIGFVCDKSVFFASENVAV